MQIADSRAKWWKVYHSMLIGLSQQLRQRWLSALLTKLIYVYLTCRKTAARDHFVTNSLEASLENPDRFRLGVGAATESVRTSLRQFGLGLDRYRVRQQVKA